MYEARHECLVLELIRVRIGNRNSADVNSRRNDRAVDPSLL